MGGIPPILEMLKSDFPVIQRLALETLTYITTDKDACNTFSEEQGYKKIMDILKNKVRLWVSGTEQILWWKHACLCAAPKHCNDKAITVKNHRPDKLKPKSVQNIN